MRQTVGAHLRAVRLHFLLYSHGIEMLGDDDRKTRKHGTDYRGQCSERKFLLVLGIPVFEASRKEPSLLIRVLDQSFQELIFLCQEAVYTLVVSDIVVVIPRVHGHSFTYPARH